MITLGDLYQGMQPMALECDINAPKKRTWEILSHAHGQIISERF
jgi:hypothetical protein